jgi:uncharacterized membrane protein (UPF0182 family)
MAPNYSVGTPVSWINVSTLAPRAPIRRTLRVLRPLVWVLLGLVVLGLVAAVFVSIDTNVFWFDSVGYSDAYRRILLTEVVMFLLFGGVTAAVLSVTTWVAARLAPTPSAIEATSRIRTRWSSLSPRTRAVLLTLVPLVGGLRAGFAAASRWPLWLQWRHPAVFHLTDPRFHRDYGYYVSIYPFHRYVETAALSLLVVALISVLVIAWLRGAVQLRGSAPRFALPLRRLLAILLAVLAVIKAMAYWLDRLGTVVSNRGVVTGQSYVDLHVVLPIKLALVGISLLLAAGYALAALRRSAAAIVTYTAVMIVAGLLLGGAVPALVQTFKVKPAAITAEGFSIGTNIRATRYGFGVQNVEPQDATPGSAPTAATLAGALQPRLLDPNVVSPTFNQLQQRAQYYGFKSTLDVDRYDLRGTQTDEVLAVRELRLAGISAKTWTNQHLVYTHGIGVVSAPTTVINGGLPEFDERGIPAKGQLSKGSLLQDRIYFGQSSPAYSIVGAPPHGTSMEFDYPDSTTPFGYAGGGGVPIGSLWRQLLYSMRFGDKNILFSSDVNQNSQLLYRRSPAARIAAIAPWLTLDGDIYPVVADGHITWIADGYTTSSMLPDSQQENFRSGTLTTYNKLGSSAQQPSTPVNYLRNSVVATVDAYTGAVNIYQKPGAPDDPLLDSWMQSFPGLVKPASQFPADLLPHLRYPQDLFNMQRYVLASYHVTQPATFYGGQQFWRVPGDPTVSASVPQPSYYATLRDADGKPEFELSTPLLSNNSNNIAAYLSVDCDPGTPGYDQLQLQTIPLQTQTEAPKQIQNDIESNSKIAHALTLLRGGQSTVKVGNLQTVDVNGNVLAVEPIYTQSRSGRTYPQLQYVVVIYGSGRPGFAKTFGAALDQTLRVPQSSTSIARLTTRAKSALQAYQSAEAAGNTAAARQALQRLGQLLDQIQAAGG